MKKIEIDKTTHEVRVNDKIIDLTYTQFKILSLFGSKPDYVFTRNEILHSVWGEKAYVTNRTVDVHIKRLNEKLSKIERSNKYIVLIHGLGFRLADDIKIEFIEIYKIEITYLGIHEYYDVKFENGISTLIIKPQNSEDKLKISMSCHPKVLELALSEPFGESDGVDFSVVEDIEKFIQNLVKINFERFFELSKSLKTKIIKK